MPQSKLWSREKYIVNIATQLSLNQTTQFRSKNHKLCAKHISPKLELIWKIFYCFYCSKSKKMIFLISNSCLIQNQHSKYTSSEDNTQILATLLKKSNGWVTKDPKVIVSALKKGLERWRSATVHYPFSINFIY